MKEMTEVRMLKEGKYVLLDDEPCTIVSIATSKPGKHGAAKARIEGIGVFDGQKRSAILLLRRITKSSLRFSSATRNVKSDSHSCLIFSNFKFYFMADIMFCGHTNFGFAEFGGAWSYIRCYRK